ncbi:MAG: LURP-one-related family protein, partial [Candidatus Izemoplasmatales bacterium]|nr:LURP-one-related family protein [Candidatus Izemoplasmatales bacterium]
YKIFDEQQNIVFHCESKFLSITHKMKLFETKTNSHLYTISRKLFTLLPNYYLVDAQGKQVARIRKRFTLFHHKIDIFSSFGDYSIEGDFMAHDFSITKDGQMVADFHKKWISWGDSYEITIYPEEQIGFYLALVIMIDNCLHDNHHSNHLISFNN